MRGNKRFRSVPNGIYEICRAFRTLALSASRYGVPYAFKRFVRITESWIRFWFWSRRNRLTPSERMLQRGWNSDGVVLSLVVPVFRPEPAHIRRLLRSVADQTSPHWELLLGIADADARARRELAFCADDPRVRIIELGENRGISANTNAIIAEARGRYIGFLDQDDFLSEEAVYRVLATARERGFPAVLYSDEAQVSGDGRLVLPPHFKPDFSPELLLSHNYICHFLAVRKDAGDAVGWLRPDFDGSQDHDLALRLAETDEPFVHIPRVLYYWRRAAGSSALDQSEKPWAVTAGARAVESAVERRGIRASVGVHSLTKNTYSVRFDDSCPGVSIVIPTKDRLDLVAPCVEAIARTSGNTKLDIVLVDTGTTDPEVHAFYRELSQARTARVVSDDGEFNFSRSCNLGAEHAVYDRILFMNNDVCPVSNGWIEQMSGALDIPGVGIVGAKLLYPDGRVQHAGIVTGARRGGGMHLLCGFPAEELGFFAAMHSLRNVSAVTAACLMTNRFVFDRVGGFDTALPVAYNDVDFCLKARQLGYRIVWTPESVLIHEESATRGRDTGRFELARLAHDTAVFRAQWRAVIASGDPYYSVHYDASRTDYSQSLR